MLRFRIGSTAVYILWQYGPTATVVATGFFWGIIYVDVCQLELFYQMAQLGGATLQDSLSQDYLTSVTWLVPFRAFRKRPRRHSAIVLSSLLYLLGCMVLPTTMVAMYRVELFTFKFTSHIAVSPAFGVVNALVLLSVIVCGVWLPIMLHRRRKGSHANPTGIAGIAAMISKCDILEHFRKLRSYDTQARIDEALGSYRLCLETSISGKGRQQIALLDPCDAASTPS